MLSGFLERAKSGQSVYICEVRDAQSDDCPVAKCVLEPAVGEPRQYIIPIPKPANPQEEVFVREYFYANIHNILSILGGKRMCVYISQEDDHIAKLCASLGDVFQVSSTKNERTGYGKCLNVADRVNAALGYPPFSFSVENTQPNFKASEASKPTGDVYEVFKKAVNNSKNAVICGIDIGGTDIKVVGTRDGSIAEIKEYDWRPSDMETVDELINPIILIVQVMSAALSLPNTARGNELRNELLRKEATDSEMRGSLEAAKKEFGQFVAFDGIGINFPDVVIYNKIVGGETPKTQTIREVSKDYEAEFSKLLGLGDLLKEYCKPGAPINIANDGSIAAYIAAVELAFSKNADIIKDGVFAHSLGTDFGTGWIDEKGEMPQIPLEMYNCVLDLGSYPARAFEATDLRSVLNFCTEIAGTPQKYAGQFGAYRIALKEFANGPEILYQQLLDKGFIEEKDSGVYVVLSPQDMRKPLLEHIMELADNGQPQAKQVFREIGKFLAAAWCETEFLLSPKAKSRVLFGRFIKSRKCFELMQEGAKLLCEVSLEAGDDGLAFSPLMIELKENPHFTVAQFGQAVGAVYFAAAGLG